MNSVHIIVPGVMFHHVNTELDIDPSTGAQGRVLITIQISPV